MSHLSVQVFTGNGVEPKIELTRIEQALRSVLEAEGVTASELSVAFVGDVEIAEMNERFLGHRGPTDVISFALHEPGDPPHGDIYVGADQATRQAEELGIPAAEEWLRLAVHGTLHVLGYEHPEEEDRTSSPMYLRQEVLLRQVMP